MSDPINAPETATAASVVRKRCPLDAAVLVHEEIDGMMGWNCPECGYFEPDLPA